MFRCVSVDFIPFLGTVFSVDFKKGIHFAATDSAKRQFASLSTSLLANISITLSDSLTHSTDISVNIGIHTEFIIFSYAYLFSVKLGMK